MYSPISRTFIEIGAHFHEANALKLAQHEKWRGIFYDDFHHFPPLGFHKAWVSVNNINALLDATNLPHNVDLFSMDIDGNDWYVVAAIDPRWRPRVIIVESNLCFGTEFDAVIQYDQNYRWDGSIYQGATPLAWVNLLKERYSLVYVEKSGVNMFFIDRELAPEKIFINVDDMNALYAPIIDAVEIHAPDSLQRPWYSSKDAKVLLSRM